MRRAAPTPLRRSPLTLIANSGDMCRGDETGKPHLISSIEQGLLPVLIARSTLQSLDLDPAPATGLALQQPQREPSDDTEVRRGMIGPHPALVLAEAHVQLPVQVVLDAPVAPHRTGELLR